jgi:hypothetical protein
MRGENPAHHAGEIPLTTQAKTAENGAVCRALALPRFLLL